MNTDKGAVVLFASEGHACCAVCFIADNQVKLGKAELFLGLRDDINGMVGGEHHRHVGGIVALLIFTCQTFRVRGRRVAQFVDFDLDFVVLRRLFLPHVAV